MLILHNMAGKPRSFLSYFKTAENDVLLNIESAESDCHFKALVNEQFDKMYVEKRLQNVENTTSCHRTLGPKLRTQKQINYLLLADLPLPAYSLPMYPSN